MQIGDKLAPLLDPCNVWKVYLCITWIDLPCDSGYSNLPRGNLYGDLDSNPRPINEKVVVGWTGVGANIIDQQIPTTIKKAKHKTTFTILHFGLPHYLAYIYKAKYFLTTANIELICVFRYTIRYPPTPIHNRIRPRTNLQVVPMCYFMPRIDRSLNQAVRVVQVINICDHPPPIFYTIDRFYLKTYCVHRLYLIYNIIFISVILIPIRMCNVHSFLRGDPESQVTLRRPLHFQVILKGVGTNARGQPLRNIVSRPFHRHFMGIPQTFPSHRCHQIKYGSYSKL